MHRQAMAVLVGMRHGLHVALTRHASAGRPGGALAVSHAEALQIEAAVLDACCETGLTYGDVLARLAAAYGDGRWQEHWQGGPIGYRQREFEIAPAPPATRWHPEPVAPHHAIAFNPSVAGGGKAEDTFLVGDGRLEPSPQRRLAHRRGGRPPSPRNPGAVDDRPLPAVGAALGALVRRARPARLPPPRIGQGDGFSRAAIDGRPVVGICNPWSELVNCNVHLRGLAEAVKRGVLAAGGLPLEFPDVSLGENLMKPTTMLFRNLMSMDVEERSAPIRSTRSS